MPSHGTELCAVVESMLSLNVMHENLGDAAYADRAERIAYNALPGTWSSDMWGHQYLQQANAANALHQDDHIWLADGPDATIFGLAPNYPCCTSNGPQGWPRFVPRMVHGVPGGGLAISILGPLTASVGGATLTVNTEYPFGDSLDISVAGAAAGAPLLVRVPGWATKATYALNGAAASASARRRSIRGGPTRLDHQLQVTLCSSKSDTAPRYVRFPPAGKRASKQRATGVSAKGSVPLRRAGARAPAPQPRNLPTAKKN